MDKIIGMGNALVDVLVTLQDDSLLDEMSLPKGSMQLINEDKFLKISGKYSGMQTHKATGGSAGNTVLALANLGAHPGFIGKIGNDDFGQYFKKNGLKQGIDMKLLAGDLPTGVASTFISPDGERTFGTYLGAAATMKAENLTLDMFKGYAYLYIEGYLVQDHELILRAMQLGKEAGLQICLDMASYNIVEGDLEFFDILITKYVDIVFANEEEAKAYTGKDAWGAINEIASKCSVVIVKLGAQGSCIKKDMFTAFDSEIQADGLPYDILYSTIAADAKSQPEHQLNIYYAGQIGKGELTWDADYYSNTYTQYTINMENSQDHEDRTVTSDNRVENQLTATKVSYTHPLWGGSISVGGEYTYTNRHDDYVNQEGYVPTTYTRIREQNLAGYAQYSHPLPFGQANIGLRYEHVDFDYFENATFVPGQSRVYDNIFPNISVNGQLGKVQFQVSYAAKTQRPNYSQLRNNITYANRFTWQTGNPLLKPSVTHDITAVGVWRFFQAMVSYKVLRDYILYWGTQVENQSATTLINYINHDRLPSLTVMLAASPTIGIWNLNASAIVMKQWFSLDAAGQRRTYNNPLFVGSLNNTFTLPAGFLLSADFNYQSRGQVQNITLKRPQYTLNIGLRKSLFNDALSIEARANDLLLGCKQEALLYMESAQMKDLSWSDTRSFSLTVRYKFNAAKSKYKGTGAGQDTINRM